MEHFTLVTTSASTVDQVVQERTTAEEAAKKMFKDKR